MQARSFELGRLTDTQFTSVVVFAGSLNPLRSHIKLIKTKYHSDDAKEVHRQLRILVKDTDKKLQTVIEHEKAKSAGDGKVIGPASK